MHVQLLSTICFKEQWSTNVHRDLELQSTSGAHCNEEYQSTLSKNAVHKNSPQLLEDRSVLEQRQLLAYIDDSYIE
jgi:hypothetical protein